MTDNKKTIETPEMLIAGAFETFGLKEPLMKALLEMGFKVPSPIQQQVIPLILSGLDVVGQAQTGTGKTAAFGLPALNAIEKGKGVQLLIMTPTRELASQVNEELCRLGKYCGIKTISIYGGQSFGKQIDGVRRGAEIVVATPGRLLDLLQSKRLPNFNPSMVVLDEADEMLDMGFLEDIQSIFEYLPKERQTLLFSATMPPAIQALAKKTLKDPTVVKLTKDEVTNKDINQLYFVVQEHEKDDAVVRLFDTKQPKKTIIFCKTRRDVDRLAHTLTGRGYAAKGLHGEMQQSQREDVVADFRSGKIVTLVATDVAARGLNIVDVTHILNYHMPYDVESYVHRIGRTGRAGKKGEAMTLVAPSELRKLEHIHKFVGTKIEPGIIPGHHDVQKMRLNELVEQIQNQTLNKDVYPILKILQDGMDLQQITCKLISILFQQQSLQGPDQIGISGQKLEKMLEQFKKQGGYRGRERKKNFSFSRKKGFHKRPKSVSFNS